MSTELATRNGNGQTALAQMAQRYAVSQEGLIDVIKRTCINGECSDAQFKAFVLVANQYQLNPMTREIHAFTDPRRGVVPIVGIDGWARIVNREPLFDGCEFEDVKDGEDVGVRCTMHVKGRAHPVRVTEWLKECKRNTPPWTGMPKRMLRHKAFMQTARIAFSLSGLFDEDEARDVIHGVAGSKPPSMAERLRAQVAAVAGKPEPEQRPAVTDETFDAVEDLECHGEAPVLTPDVSTWESTWSAAEDYAIGADMESVELSQRVSKFLVETGKKGKAESTTEDERRAFLASLRKESNGV